MTQPAGPRPNRAARRAAAKTRPRPERRRKVVAGAQLAASGLMVTSGLGLVGPGVTPAGAATFTVTNTNNSGAGSLRQAVIDANNAAGPDLITFDAALTAGGPTAITLYSQIRISDDVTITGPGAGLLTVHGSASNRIFYLYNNAAEITATISGLTLTDGRAFEGGAIKSLGENLVVADSVVTGNTASAAGGAIHIEGAGADLTVTDSEISGNSVTGLYGPFLYETESGGGIHVGYTEGATVSISGSDVRENFAPRGGGGVYLYGDGATTISDSTISDNSVKGGIGGGVLAGYELDTYEYVPYYYIPIGYLAAPEATSRPTARNGSLVVSDTTISGNLASAGGGMLASGDVELTIVDSTISENTALRDGGGIAVSESSGDIAINATTFAYNTASYYGGGLSFDDLYGDVSITGSTISNNTAAYLYEGDFEYYSGRGGGIFVGDFYYGSTLTVSATTIADNEAGRDGGGMFLESRERFRFRRDSGADSVGPANVQGAVVITGSTITGNVAAGPPGDGPGGPGGSGGGVAFGRFDYSSFEGPGLLDSNSNDAAAARPTNHFGGLTISDSTISGNQSSVGGGVFFGGLYYDLDISGSTISENQAIIGGGVATDLYLFPRYIGEGPYEYGAYIGDITISDSTISSNLAYIGGGLNLPVVTAGGVSIADTTIADNTALFAAGGASLPVYAYEGTTVSGSTISGNTASGAGGLSNIPFLFGPGIGVVPQDFSEALAEAASRPAGLATPADHAEVPTTIVNSTISGNDAIDGPAGGVFWFPFGAPLHLSHSTVTDNTSYYAGGGITTALFDEADPAPVVLDHTIVAGNEALYVDEGPPPEVVIVTAEGTDNDLSGTFDASWSLIGDVGSATVNDLGGTNTFGVDPLLGDLADNGGPTLTHLPDEGSPVIDAGDPAIADAPATDQRGLDRISDGRIDQGAVETQAAPPPPPPPPPPDCTTDFTALHPIRALDTRNGSPVGAGAEVTVKVTGITGPGSQGVPATGVSAVAINLTSTNATAESFITVYPDGETRPNASNLNTDPGVDTANMVLAKVGTDGNIVLYNNAGVGDLVVDVLGWFGDCGEYRTLSPERVLDTRNTGGALGAGETRPLTVLGVAGVPTTDVASVVMNITSTDATDASFVTIWGAGAPRPGVSNLNTEPGADVANLSIVQPGTGGQVSMYNENGTVNLVVDILGYYTTDSIYVPVVPTRLDDTRTSAPVGPATSINVSAAGGASPAPSTAASAIVNLTSTQASVQSFVTAHAAGTPLPPTSNVNTEPGQDVANLAIVQIGTDGQITLYNNAGTGHLITDIVGYFRPDA